MKKVMLIMAAALLMMTQCKKENETPTDPAEGTVKMTVTAGPGRTGIDTENGAITWSAGDKLYVSDGTNWLGSLTLIGDGGSAQGTFTGNIVGIGESETTCHFFYLGHDNSMTEPTGSTAANISFAAQDGTLAGAMKYHLGYGNTTNVTVTDDEAIGSVIMNTKIAIAHLNLITAGSQAYTGSVTMEGTGICNVMTVNPNGTFSGSGTDGITIGATTTGEKYVTLIPTTGMDRVDVAFTDDAIGSMIFLAGIQANKFYGMSNAMEVTVKPVAFSVGMDGDTPRTVKFAPGNLYWDGSAFRFEENQWKTTPTANGTWDANHVSHFYWSNTTDWQTSGKEPYASSYSYSTQTTSDVFFTNSSSFQVAGETAGTWRTLTRDEWNYLLGYDPEQYMQTEECGRPNAKSLCAWKKLDGGTHNGLVILPDGTENPSTVMGGITSTSHLATSGAVFLPAAGYRGGTDVLEAGYSGSYWSGTPDEHLKEGAYTMFFRSGRVMVGYCSRGSGNAVRLVR